MLVHLTRRDMFGMAAGVAAGAMFGPRLQAVAPAMAPAIAPLTLGLASYSFREFSLDQTLAMAKRLAITHMTFKDVHLPRTDPPETTRALAAKIRAAGITNMGGGTITMNNDAAQIKKDFEYAKNAGFPLIYIAPDPAALDTIEQLAKSYDIQVAIHNHGPEDKWFPRPQDAYAAIKSRDKRMGLCLDVGHSMRAGADPVHACRECRDRLYDMHMKDLRVKTEKDSQVEVGRGVLDVPALFKTLIQIGYRGQVGLEYEINAKDPFAGVAESMAYMRGVLATLATT